MDSSNREDAAISGRDSAAIHVPSAPAPDAGADVPESVHILGPPVGHPVHFLRSFPIGL